MSRRIFLVWEDGEEESDAVKVKASDPVAAAEIEAEKRWEGEDRIEFVVRDGDLVFDVTVDVEREVSFDGMAMLRKPE